MLGGDDGLALDHLTAELIRQEQLMDAHLDSTSPAAARHDFAAGCRLYVSKVVAGRFWQSNAMKVPTTMPPLQPT